MRPIVVFGASGHLGRLIAAALIRRGLPTILAGRDAAKLGAVRAALELGGAPEPEVRVADAEDGDAVRAMLEGASVVVNAVGPFLHLGEAIIEAAIAAGAHYIDTSAEQVFQKRMRERHHAAAKREGLTVLLGHGSELAFGFLGAAMLDARFGDLHRLDSYYDLGELDPSWGMARSVVANLGEDAIRFEAGRAVPLAHAALPPRSALPGYDTAPFAVPFAGGEAALLPFEMPSLRSVGSHVVLPRAGAHGAALGFVSQELLRPLLRPPLVGLLARQIDDVGRRLAKPEARRARPFKVTVTATSRAAHHAAVFRGESADEASGEVAALLAERLGGGAAKRAGVISAGAALDVEALVDALEARGLRATALTWPRANDPMGKHEVQTTAVALAPADEVWKRLLETNAWGRWNEVLAGLRGDIREGEKVKLVVSAKGGRKLEIPVRVEVVEAGRELRWSGGIAGLMRGTHYFRLEAIDESHTRITHGERFDGAGAVVSWPFLSAPLRERYQQITDQLAQLFEAKGGAA
jgi:hypothetical protein